MVRLLKPDRPRPRNYSSRREQLRLLVLIVPLGLVVIVMARLRDPETANRINQFFAPAANESAIKPRPLVADPASSLSPAPFPGINAELLNTIEDNTYFRNAEKDAWMHFLELVKKDDIDPAQSVNIDYVQLVDQPNVYRGTLVTVRGAARQITKENPAENDLGLTSYYRVVIQPADGANWPIIVYCLQLPSGVSTGDEISFDVKASGLFFKKLSYKWRDGLGIAPVIVSKSIEPSEGESQNRLSASNTTIGRAESPADDNNAVSNEPLENSPDGQAAFLKILTLSGWDADRLAKFDDGQPLSDAQRVEALELLRRLRSIDTTSLDKWSHYLPFGYELTNPDEVRGTLRRLVGRVTKVTKHSPAAADAERLEMPEYFECELELQNLAGPATILTTRVPKNWLRGEKHDGAVAANVLYLKQLADEAPPRSVWLAKEIAWYPGVPSTRTSIDDLFRDSRDPLLGKSMLGTGMMDVGLLDQVESRGRIRPQERDVFYKVLSAAGIIKPSTLVRIANDNLPAVKQEWQRQLRGDGPARRTSLAREVVRQADEGQYSVALLFNDPKPQIGRLFVFDGVARRAVRVEVGGTSDDAGSSDIAQSYNLDHYYELEVFTGDSQNYPLVFVARELPKDFPVGADIRVPVRIAGFFFKNWLYSTRGSRSDDDPSDAKSTGPKAQFAPLLIGRAPIIMATAQPGGHAGRFVLGGLFVLALVGIWAAAAWFARGDRRFRERTPAANFSLPPGESLNELNLPAAPVPIIDVGASIVRGRDSE
ncbi:MAG: hypothetical protein L0228_10945 [Planctomycetes bacterium]|nr:hypothetical protein [Planctomycetota bacterium]